MNLIAKIATFFRLRGTFFFCNIGIVLFIFWLTLPLIYHTSASFKLVKISRYRDLLIIIILIIPQISIAYLSIVGGARLNRIMFCLIICLFISGETYLRIFKPVVDDSSIYRNPRPYYEFTGKPDLTMDTDTYLKMGGTKQDAVLVLNKLGFRGPLPPKEKANEFRVIMLGGSTVFNGVPLSNSIAGRIEKLFHQDGYKEVRVYNWGVVSFISGQELSLLVHTVPEYDPDLVIIYDGANDIIQPYSYDPRPGYPYNWLVYEAGLKMARGSEVKQTLASIAASSRVFNEIFIKGIMSRTLNIDALRIDSGYMSIKWQKEIARNYVNNLIKMCKISKAFNFNIAFFLQPTLLFKSHLLGDEGSLLGSDEFQRYVKEVYEDIRINLRATGLLKESSSCFAADISKIFEDYPEKVYWDIVHVNNSGNSYIANQIYSRLKKAGIMAKAFKSNNNLMSTDQ